MYSRNTWCASDCDSCVMSCATCAKPFHPSLAAWKIWAAMLHCHWLGSLDGLATVLQVRASQGWAHVDAQLG